MFKYWISPSYTDALSLKWFVWSIIKLNIKFRSLIRLNMQYQISPTHTYTDALSLKQFVFSIIKLNVKFHPLIPMLSVSQEINILSIIKFNIKFTHSHD